MGISVGTYDTAIPSIEYARAECTMLTIHMTWAARIGQIFLVIMAFRMAVSIDCAAPGGRKIPGTGLAALFFFFFFFFLVGKG